MASGTVVVEVGTGIESRTALVAFLEGVDSSRGKDDFPVWVVPLAGATGAPWELEEFTRLPVKLAVLPEAPGASAEGLWLFFEAAPTVREDHDQSGRRPIFEVLAEAPAATAVVLAGGEHGTGAGVFAESGAPLVLQEKVALSVDAIMDPTVHRVSARQAGALVGRILTGSSPDHALRDQQEVLRILAGIRAQGGYDFRAFKANGVQRSIRNRANALGFETLREFADEVAVNPEECQRLSQALCVGVTEFFRNPRAFEMIERELLPALIDGIEDGGVLRLWSVGCSTGQEPYSLAMICAEVLRAKRPDLSFQVFATDVNERAVQACREGLYSEEEMVQVSEERRRMFFERVRLGWRVKEELRRRVLAVQHCVEDDPPFTRIHLATCRNVLIYLRPDVQRTVASRLRFALVSNGALVLGESESIDFAGGFLAQRWLDGEVYRAVGAAPQFRRFSAMPNRRRPSAVNAPPSLAERYHAALAEHYVPPTVVVDAGGAVLHVLGDTSDIMGLPVGPASMSLQRLAKGNIAAVATAAIQRAQREREEVTAWGVEHPDGGPPLRIRVRPMPDTSGEVMLTFERDPEKPSPGDVPDAVHRELVHTRETLQTTIEELQSRSLEYQHANEELQAINDELQATVEELQATNEELLSVTAEREARIEELQALNDDIHHMVSVGDVGTVFLDRAGRIRKFTKPVQRFLPIREGDVGRPIVELQTGAMDSRISDLWAKVSESGEPRDLTVRVAEHLVVLVRAMPISTKRGGVVLSFVDVTAIKEMETLLQEVVDALPQHIAVLRGDGAIRLVNRAWRNFSLASGCTPEENGVGTNYLRVCREAAAKGDASAAEAMAGIAEVLGGVSSGFNLEYPCHSDSEQRFFVMQVRPLSWEPSTGGAAAVVSHLDITSRVMAESETAASHRRYRTLFHSAAAPVLSVNTRTLRVGEANSAAVTCLGRPHDVLLGSSLRMLVPDGEWDIWRAALAVAESKPDGFDGELPFMAGRGRVVRQRMMIQSLAGEEPVLLVSLGFQVKSGQGRSERTLRLEALGSLAGGVAHELNNVLAAVLAIASTWEELPGVHEELRRDLDDVVAACLRGREVTGNLLSFARNESEPGRPVVLNDVVDEVMNLICRTSPKDVRFSVQMPDEEVMVRARRGQLGQGVMNLVLNSLDAIDGEGNITVNVAVRHRDDGHFAELAVGDDGQGMDPETQSRAFEPFFSTKARDSGTGLGLPMVYGMARGAGGDVELESELGVGTVVRILLPLAERASVVAVPSAGPTHGTFEGCVLLVDDDPLARRSTRRLLQARGIAVIEAEDGSVALERLQAQEQAVEGVVLDIVMPGDNGLVVLERLRETHSTLPVVLYSGFADADEGWEQRLDPCTAYVQKPAPERVIDALGRLQERRRLQAPEGSIEADEGAGQDDLGSVGNEVNMGTPDVFREKSAPPGE